MKLLARMEKSKNCWVLLFVSFLFFILRLPSLFEPYWYGDEGIYQVLGLAVRQGRLLYRDIWDNKPPLLYLLYSVFSSDQFSVRLASLVFGILSVIVFFFLCKKLFMHRENDQKGFRISVFSTLIFSLFFSIPLLEGNIANSENFMLLPILAAAYLVFAIENKKNVIKKSLASLSIGLLLSIAFLFKIVAVFDLAAFLIFILFINLPSKDSFRNFFKNKKYILSETIGIGPLLIGFSLPILLTLLFFFANGALSDFINAALVQNVGYVSYGNTFLFSQGLLLVKLIILAVFILFLFIKRANLTKTSLFIFIWLSFSVFNAFFSQRPYTHYLLVLLPGLVLFLGLIFYDKKLQKINTFLFILILILLSKSFSVYGKTVFYYQNFISFITHKESTSSYIGFFDKRAVKDYEIAQFVNSHTEKNDGIFVWGNSAQIYKMTDKLPPGRFTVAYHVTFYKNSIKETDLALNRAKPKYIIVQPYMNTPPFSLSNYRQRINLADSVIYELIF